MMQAIRRRGGYVFFPIRARLGFHNVGAQHGGSYWTVRDPLQFELSKLDREGWYGRRVRVGPK